ncbi:MAG: shikimate kinase [Ignavibacteriales bacterium]
MHSRIIYLTGFMTSGKSTIGPILGNVLGWDFLDLDYEIENHEKMSVDEIFEKNGESYFREKEKLMLGEISKRKNLVVSLGGGTISWDDNISVIKKSGKLIYLKAKPETIYLRIKNKINRPLFKDLVLKNASKEDFIKKILEYLNKREVFYNQADLVINTDNIDIGKTVDIIANKISKWTNEQN